MRREAKTNYRPPEKLPEEPPKEPEEEAASSEKEKFVCSECGRGFSTKRGLSIHMRVH